MSQRGGPNPYLIRVGNKHYEITDMYRFLYFMTLKMSRNRLKEEEAFRVAARMYNRRNQAHAARARQPKSWLQRLLRL